MTQAAHDARVRPALATGCGAYAAPAGVKLLRPIGSGGTADVYLGVRQGQRVAIKFCRERDPETLRRFVAEAGVLRGLAHASIAGVLETGVHRGVPYLVLEYVDGGPLTEFTDRVEDPQERLELFRRVCEVLAFAHGRGVVHRDLKPANILVDRRARPFVIDFGAARELEGPGHTTTGAAPLTPSYASPEQILGFAATPASDVYALGLLLHRVLFGLEPRDASQGAALPHEGVPAGIDAVLACAVTLDPAHRYADASELHDEIERLQRGRRPRAWRRRLRARLLQRAPVPLVLTVAMFAGYAVAAGGAATDSALGAGPPAPTSGSDRTRPAPSEAASVSVVDPGSTETLDPDTAKDRIHAQYSLAVSLGKQGRPAEAARVFTDTVALAQRHGMSGKFVRWSLLGAARAQQELGDFPASMATLAEVRGLDPTTLDRLEPIRLALMQAAAARGAFEVDAAREHLEEARERLNELPIVFAPPDHATEHLRAQLDFEAGAVAHAAGDFPATVTFTRDALRRLERLPNATATELTPTATQLANACLVVRDIPCARRAYDRAVAATQTTGARHPRAAGLALLRAALALENDDLDEAAQALEDHRTRTTRLPAAHPLRLRAAPILAELWRRQGRRTDAQQHLRAALAVAQDRHPDDMILSALAAALEGFDRSEGPPERDAAESGTPSR